MGVTAIGGGTAQQSYLSRQAADGEAQSRPAQSLEKEKDQGQSLQEMLREAREKADARREALKPKNTIRYGDGPMEAYARLARARNPAQASAAASFARRRIAQYKAAMRRDSDNAERIQAAIHQLQKAVGRAGKKRRDLEREQAMRARQKRLEQEDERARAARLKQELHRRQTMRLFREQGYISEAESDNRMQEYLAQARMELRLQARELSAATGFSVPAAAQQYAAQTGAAEAGAAAASVDLQA